MNEILKQNLQSNENFLVGDVHQAILDVAYEHWQFPENKKWSYGDMVDWVRQEFGPSYALAILIGKYNQQVCNGGHTQYYDNGYACGASGYFSKHDTDMPLHGEMIELLKSRAFKSELKDRAVTIMEKMEPKPDDDGPCESCGCSCESGGLTESWGDMMSQLDSEYYEINERLMVELNTYFVDLVKKDLGIEPPAQVVTEHPGGRGIEDQLASSALEES